MGAGQFAYCLFFLKWLHANSAIRYLSRHLIQVFEWRRLCLGPLSHQLQISRLLRRSRHYHFRCHTFYLRPPILTVIQDAKRGQDYADHQSVGGDEPRVYLCPIFHTSVQFWVPLAHLFKPAHRVSTKRQRRYCRCHHQVGEYEHAANVGVDEYRVFQV